MPKRVFDFFNLEESDQNFVPAKVFNKFRFIFRKYRDSNGHNRSNQEQSIFTALVSEGLDFYTIKELFDNFSVKSSHYMEHSDKNNYIKTSMKSAKSFLRKNKPSKVNLRSLRQNVFKHFTNGCFRYQKDILLNLLEKAEELNTLTFDMSVRELAKNNNTTAKTVSKSLVNLVSIGLLSVTKHKASCKPYTYTINTKNIEDKLGEVTIINNYNVSDCYLSRSTEKDSLKTSKFIVKNLAIFEHYKGLTNSKFAKIAGISVGAAYYQLKRMVSLNFISKIGTSFEMVGNTEYNLATLKNFVTKKGYLTKLTENIKNISFTQAYFVLSYSFLC